MIKIKSKANLNYAGSCSSSKKGHDVIICPDFIKEKYEQGFVFMGIKPDSFLHALQIVLEHEMCHVILWYKGVLGHGDLFMDCASRYGHTDYKIRRGDEDSKDKDKDSEKAADSRSSS